MLQRRGIKEVGGLFVLFALLIGIASFYEQVGQERVASNAPTTENTKTEGVRALYLLYQREGFHAELLKSPWSSLSPSDGLLVFVEPADPDRGVDRNDMKVLDQWIRGGGTLLDLVAAPPVEQPLDPSNPISGDCGATAGSSEPHKVPIEDAANSPLLVNVKSLTVASEQRLKLADRSPYTILARDSEGVIAVQKPLGKGNVIIVANRFGATNAGLSLADNAIMLVNIAALASSNGRAIRFDEYHHGVGFAERTTAAGGLWSSIPLPLRLVFLHLIGVSLLLLYNGNRRFGPARHATPISMRASTDYVNSMARLYKRAGAGDIAIETLYGRFLRDLKRAMDAPAEVGVSQLARLAQQRYGSGAEGLQELLFRGEGVVAGQRLTEADMLKLAQQIEHFRRACQLVGI